ncbi:hypothetical protein FAES_2579 [Fibrella aestuarina BUZ 2]|uniref:DUF2975 domain-containing protein n=1 Tax=Fibrella aestuarina BUZ 2 TaxID=1166018 RepID=I0K8Y5_9BACT|nr:DUF2975 domain-containing protein [Fibrella aestuarina]CCH00588.1 hypothetical protein FAES_2579 [Fibrella aestuarina BUZ 2]
MKNLRLIRWLYLLSTFFLYLEGALLFISFIAGPLTITAQTYATPDKQRVRYDTTLNPFVMSSESSTPVISSKGGLIHRITRDSVFLSYYDGDLQLVDRLQLDSLQRLLHPTLTDHIPNEAHQQALLYQQRMTRQIDSALAVNPDAAIIRMPDRWLLQPVTASGFALSVNVPLYGDVWPKGHYLPESPQQWRRNLTYQPYTYLEPNLDKRLPYVLRASIHRWSDLNSFVGPLLLISHIWGIFYLAMLMLITQWFREIFADLLNEEFFGERTARRVQQSGWLFIGAFVLKNGVDIFQPILALRYLQTQGFVSYQGWLWSGPDYWSWLWAGLILLAFAQVFRYGTQLQQESELTI